MTQLHGKVAIVTGGGRGLGLAIAERLVDDGARVAIVGRSRSTLDKAVASLSARGGEVLAIEADVAHAEGVDQIFAEFTAWSPALDVLVNNAGIADEAYFPDVTRQGWDDVIAINLTAPFFLAQRAATLMRDGGAIVSLGSVDAQGADGPYSSYVVAKAGLIGMTKAIAVELAPLGIRVNQVSPGWTLTDMAAETTSDAMLTHMKTDFRRVPMRRMMTPEEIASAVVFLCGPQASAITGADLVVDGGTLANLYILDSLPDEEDL